VNGSETMKINVSSNGPFLIRGSVPIATLTIVADREGNSIGWRRGEELETKLSRALGGCGRLAHKPYVDRLHVYP
jgi:CDGSH-type Zn-finger protein